MRGFERQALEGKDIQKRQQIQSNTHTQIFNLPRFEYQLGYFREAIRQNAPVDGKETSLGGLFDVEIHSPLMSFVYTWCIDKSIYIYQYII